MTSINNLPDLMNTYIMPMALPILRESCLMPALVSHDYADEAHQQNQTIRVPLPQDLGPAQDFDTSAGSSSTALGDPKVDIVLDQWKYKQFEMNDNEMASVVTGAVLPSAALAAIRSVANAIDLSLLGLYKDIPFSVGTMGTLPADTGEIINTRKVLNDNLVPSADRFMLLNTAAEAAYLKYVTQWMNTGPVSTDALREAYIGRLHGFDIFTDQLMLQHVQGTATVSALTVAANVTAGSVGMAIAGATGTATLNKGDLFSIAGVLDANGNPVPFVITATVAALSGSFGAVAFYPALPVNVASSSALTFQHNSSGFTGQSLAFHKDAFMVAMRTLSNEASENSTISVQTDPVSGIPLRLETWRDPRLAKRMWRFDVLYGVKTLRPQLAVRQNG